MLQKEGGRDEGVTIRDDSWTFLDIDIFEVNLCLTDILGQHIYDFCLRLAIVNTLGNDYANVKLCQFRKNLILDNKFYESIGQAFPVSAPFYRYLVKSVKKAAR